MKEIIRIIDDFCARTEGCRVCLGKPDGDNMAEVGIAVNQKYSYMEVLMQFTKYLDEQNYVDTDFALEGIYVKEQNQDMIIYFPGIRTVG